MNKCDLLVIIGPTASGKSSLAMKIAPELNGEIIAADSWTVRKGCNIGTAKPSKSEQAEVAHHLLDVVDPCQDFSAAVYKDLAQQSIKNIQSQSKLPIMVGGTGLYIDGVLFDYGFLPHADRVERAKLSELSVDELVAIAHKKGLSTYHIDERNKRRVIRLIETMGQQPTKSPLRAKTLIVGIIPSKASLQARIDTRVKNMVRSGLEAEVKALVQKYGWGCEALKGIGYQEWREYFNGSQTLDTTQERIIKNTQQLAKRQVTWFKRNKAIQWFNDPSQAHKFICTSLKNH